MDRSFADEYEETRAETRRADFQITFEAGTVARCDFIGRTVSGVCAVVRENGVEVFRSKAHSKRIAGRIEAERFVDDQIAEG